MDPSLPLWLQSALAAPSPVGGQPGSGFPAIANSPYSGVNSPYGPAAVARALSPAGSSPQPQSMPNPQPQSPAQNQDGGINQQYNSFGNQVGALLGNTIQGKGSIAQGISNLFGGGLSDTDPANAAFGMATGGDVPLFGASPMGFGGIGSA